MEKDWKRWNEMERYGIMISVETSLEISVRRKLDSDEEICVVTITIDVNIEYFKNIINKFSIT
jgi:hypothetical protein